MKNSQNQQIRKYLEAGNRITALDALRLFNCFRLSARIADLRKEGLKITSRIKRTETDKNVSEYWLVMEEC